MPWTPPGLAEIHRRIRADWRAQIAGAEPGLWPNNLYVMTKVFAGVADAYYQRLAWLRDQRFAHLAEGDSLIDHAAELGLAPDPPAFAAGSIIVTATIGTPIPADTRIMRGDGEIFLTDEDVTTTQATTVLPVHAENPGPIPNTEEDVVLALEDPTTIPAWATAVVAGGGLSGGREQENDASLKAKILDAKRNPPIQGALREYIRWAKEWPGVTRAWAFRATPSPGNVSVFFMMDDTYVGGIPTASDVAGVQAILDAKAPGRSGLIVQAPVAQAIAVTFTALSPNTLSVQNEVTNELTAMVKRMGRPGTFERPFVFQKSWLDEAASIAPDEDSHTMSVPAGNVTFQAAAPGNAPFIPTLGTVTFP